MNTNPSTPYFAKEVLRNISTKQLHVLKSVDNRSLRDHRGAVRSIIFEEMSQMINRIVIEQKMTEEPKEFHTEFRMSCYVLTDEDIFKLIEAGRSTR